jgi:hypothetical protein
MGQVKEQKLKEEDAKAYDSTDRFFKKGKVLVPQPKILTNEEQRKNRELRRYWDQYIEKGSW